MWLAVSRDCFPESLAVNRRKAVIAEYEKKFGKEGICVGPKLADGRQLLILICDSQNQHRGILRDWFKTIILP